MKPLFDFFPVITFFGAYVLTKDIYYATAWLIGGSAILVAGNWFIFRRIDKLHLFTFILVLVFGSMTLLLRDPGFIQWRPTITDWALALALFISKFAGEKSLAERFIGAKISLPSKTWQGLTNLWVGFFIFSGAANLYVFMNYSEAFWVTFKLFGELAISIVFIGIQSIYIFLAFKNNKAKILKES